MTKPRQDPCRGFEFPVRSWHMARTGWCGRNVDPRPSPVPINGVGLARPQRGPLGSGFPAYLNRGGVWGGTARGREVLLGGRFHPYGVVGEVVAGDRVGFVP